MRQYLKRILVQNVWQKSVYSLFGIAFGNIYVEDWFVKIKFGLMLHTNQLIRLEKDEI